MKMSSSGKFEIPSGKRQGILFPSERGNPELPTVLINYTEEAVAPSGHD